MTVRYKSYGPRNRLPKVRVRRYRQRLHVDIHTRRKRRRKVVAARREARARADSREIRAVLAWAGPDLAWAGRIWPGLRLVGPAGPRLGRTPGAARAGCRTHLVRRALGARLGALRLGWPRLGASRLGWGRLTQGWPVLGWPELGWPEEGEGRKKKERKRKREERGEEERKERERG